MNIEALGEAIAFLREHPYTYLATVEEGVPWVRPMVTSRIDDSGAIWYPTRISTTKVRQVRENPHVCIAAYHQGVYLRIFGRAEVVDDKVMKLQLWDENWTAYFAGVDDPEYVLLKVTPERVELGRQLGAVATESPR